MKNTLLRGSITLSLGLLLTALGHGQQWSGESNLGGNFTGDPAVAQIPGTNVLQVFYHGGDNALWTHWRNPDGTWANETSLGGQLYVAPCTTFPNAILDFICWGKDASPSAVQIPGTNVLEVFYRGSDNHLRAFQRNANGWTAQDFGGTLSGNPSAVQVPGGGDIQVFYRGVGYQPNAFNGNPDQGGHLMTQWGNLNSWTSEQQMPGKLSGYYCRDQPSDFPECTSTGFAANYDVPRAFQQPGTNNLWVFYRGQDGGILNYHPTIYAQKRYSDGTWSGEMGLGGNPDSNIIPSFVPGTNVLQLFYYANYCDFFSCWQYLGTMWYPN